MDSKQCEQTEIQKLDLKIERWIDKCIKCKVDRKSIQQSLNNQLIERLDQAQNWITIKSLFKQFMIYLIICCLVVGLLCHCEFISDVTKSIGRILLIKVNTSLNSKSRLA